MAYIDISEKLYSPENIIIDRENKDFPHTVSVKNKDNESIFTCDQSWTDEQIQKQSKLQIMPLI